MHTSIFKRYFFIFEIIQYTYGFTMYGQYKKYQNYTLSNIYVKKKILNIVILLWMICRQFCRKIII